MNRRQLAAAALSAAVGLALGMQASPRVAAEGMANPPQVVKDNMAKMQREHLEKCYGINAAAKNDCAEGAHSCAGQATQARDPKSFVMLPAGDCGKIAGGKSTARGGGCPLGLAPGAARSPRRLASGCASSTTGRSSKASLR